jgi:hypothetical protein
MEHEMNPAVTASGPQLSAAAIDRIIPHIGFPPPPVPLPDPDPIGPIAERAAPEGDVGHNVANAHVHSPLTEPGQSLSDAAMHWVVDQSRWLKSLDVNLTPTQSGPSLSSGAARRLADGQRDSSPLARLAPLLSERAMHWLVDQSRWLR